MTSNPSSFDLDYFNIELASEINIETVTLISSNVVTSDWIVLEQQLKFRLADGVLSYQVIEDMLALSQSVQVDILSSTLGPHNIQVGPFHASSFTDVSPSAEWDWTVEIITSNVSAVPIPATIWLMCTGLLGMAGFSCKKKSQVVAA